MASADPQLASVATIDATAAGYGWLRACWKLFRPPIAAMVLFSMSATAWVLAGSVPLELLAHALAGTGLIVLGGICMNQLLERASDACMARTASRPLPTGRLTATQASWLGMGVSTVGLIWLGVATTLPVFLTGLASWLIYVWVYTPLKSRSAWQTPVGAVAGAMPMLIGAAVVDATFSLQAWVLFGVMFLWQLPHAMAIAWKYRRQYADAGIRVASVTDPTGRTAGALSVVGAVALLAVSLLPCLMATVGWGYAAVAVVLGVFYLAASVRFARAPGDRTARVLLRCSLVYLPLLLIALLAASAM